jgi:hypothetical protein
MDGNPPAVVVYVVALGLAVLLSLVCSWGLTVIIKRRKQSELDFVSAITLTPVDALEELKSKIVSLQTLSSAGANDEQALINLRAYLQECRMVLPDLTAALSDWQTFIESQRENKDEFLAALMDFQKWTSQQIKRLSFPDLPQK